MKNRATQLVETLLNGGDGGSDYAVENALLIQFFRGYPIENVLVLLRSNQENAVKAGAWIASEMGIKIAPLIDELSEFIDHPIPYVRFFMIDPVLVAATSEQGGIIAKAVLLVNDREASVRRQAHHFLARAANDQLAASVAYLHDDEVQRLVRWLVSAENTDVFKRSVGEKLRDEDALSRAFAVAAAARLNEDGRAFLEEAASDSDAEVSLFATQELAL